LATTDRMRRFFFTISLESGKVRGRVFVATRGTRRNSDRPSHSSGN
jgi:hypothetical protein